MTKLRILALCAIMGLVGLGLSPKANAQAWSVYWTATASVQGNSDVGLGYPGQLPAYITYPPAGTTCKSQWIYQSGTFQSGGDIPCVTNMKRAALVISVRLHGTTTWHPADNFTVYDIAPECCTDINQCGYPQQPLVYRAGLLPDWDPCTL